MKITWIKTAFVLSLLASGGAIGLASNGHHPFGEIQKVQELPLSQNEYTHENQKQNERWSRKSLPNQEFVSKDKNSNKVELRLHMTEDGSIRIDEVSGHNELLNKFVRTRIEGRKKEYQLLSSEQYAQVDSKSGISQKTLEKQK